MDTYSGLVWSLARRFLNNATDAEDAVQEIFVDLWSHAGRYDPARSAEKTFVAMIARRRLIDRCRREQARPTPEILPEAGELPSTEADHLETVETKDEAERIAALIDTLRPEQQQVIRMSIFDGCSHSEIAEQLSLPLGTIKTHIRRGMIEIREILAREQGEE